MYECRFCTKQPSCAGGPNLPHAVTPQESGPEGNLMAPKKNLDRLKMPYKEMSADEIMA